MEQVEEAENHEQQQLVIVSMGGKRLVNFGVFEAQKTGADSLFSCLFEVGRTSRCTVYLFLRRIG